MLLRLFLSAVLGIGIALQPALVPIAAQTPPSVRLLVVPIETDATAYYASDLGLFAKYGLNVDVQVVQNGSSVAAAISGGAAEIGYANLISIAQAVENGIPFAVILPCSTFSASTPPTSVLVVGKNSPIRTAKDLNGKTVGLNGIGGLQQLGPMIWMDTHGGDSKSVHWLDLPPAQEPVALAQGRVDAVYPAEPFASMAVSQGARVLANPFTAIGRQFVTGAWFAARPWAEAHPDIVSKLQHALTDAAIWANAHPKESAAILTKFSKQTPETIAASARSHFAETTDPAEMRPELAAAAQYGLLKAPLDGATLLLRSSSSGGKEN